jgi:hypothetical protein
MSHLLYIIIVIIRVIVIVIKITRKRERAYAPRSLNGLPLLKRLDGGRRTQSRLLIITRATDGRSEEGHRLRIGERVPETVSGEATNNQPKETTNQ